MFPIKLAELGSGCDVVGRPTASRRLESPDRIRRERSEDVPPLRSPAGRSPLGRASLPVCARARRASLRRRLRATTAAAAAVRAREIMNERHVYFSHRFAQWTLAGRRGTVTALAFAPRARRYAVLHSFFDSDESPATAPATSEHSGVAPSRTLPRRDTEGKFANPAFPQSLWIILWHYAKTQAKCRTGKRIFCFAHELFVRY